MSGTLVSGLASDELLIILKACPTVYFTVKCTRQGKAIT